MNNKYPTSNIYLHNIYVLLTLTLLTSCVRDKVEMRKLKISNNSNDMVYWIRSESGRFEKPYFNSDLDTIPKQSIYSIGSFNVSWDARIERSKNKKLTIFIVAKDSIDKYGWEYVYKQGIITEKYIVDMEYLKKHKWSIVYR